MTDIKETMKQCTYSIWTNKKPGPVHSLVYCPNQNMIVTRTAGFFEIMFSFTKMRYATNTKQKSLQSYNNSWLMGVH